jgi:hypothetical protein
MAARTSNFISLTECNSGTTQKLPFEVNTKIELKNTTTSENTGTLLSRKTARWMPLLSDITVILLISIIELTPNGQFMDCATIAFGE